VPAVTPPLAPPTPPPPSMPAFFWTHCSVPGAPAAPSLASRARSNLKVKWAPPSETGGKQVTQYQLKMRPPPARAEGNGGASWQADADGFVEIYQGSEPSCKVPRLVPGQDYAFRVRAFNCIGGGPFSPEAIFSTNPSVPAQPGPPSTVAQTPTSVTLQWESPHSGGAEITAYVLEIDDGEGGAFAMVYTGEQTCCQLGTHEGQGREAPALLVAGCFLAIIIQDSLESLLHGLTLPFRCCRVGQRSPLNRFPCLLPARTFVLCLSQILADGQILLCLARSCSVGARSPHDLRG
jgi:hypothetical protein